MTKPDKKLRLKEAWDHLNYCEKYEGGIIDETEGMTDDEIIAYADNLSDRGDAAYDAWKERFT
jgi:hypothetical protein